MILKSWDGSDNGTYIFKGECDMEFLEGGLPPIPDYLLKEAEKLNYILDNDNGDFLDKLSHVYDYIDKFNEYLGNYAACTKGCSHCCKIDVQISQAEAELIHIKTKVPIDLKNSISYGYTTPCPFLSDENNCKIYKYRPLPCRMLHAFGSPDNCKPGNVQNEYGSPASNFGNHIFLSLVQYIHMNNKAFGGTFRDIRDYFHR